jgi:Rrf2 family transcriptional regulator, cysteine metabolism repressor
MHLLAREETGLRCLLQVALGGTPGGPVPIAQIAAGEDISSVYAAKLMRQLRIAGLVESTRGAAGGYLLSRPADHISVWDAIRALDESFLPEADCECDPRDRLDCRRTTSCAVSSLWRRLGEEIRRELEAVTLADLCGGALERPDHVELPTLSDTGRGTGSQSASTRGLSPVAAAAPPNAPQASSANGVQPIAKATNIPSSRPTGRNRTDERNQSWPIRA